MPALLVFLRRSTVAALLSIFAAAPVVAKEVIKFADLQDPVFEAAVYPITSGKIKSDLVDLDISFLGIPALNQAPATRQYDIIHAASISVPRGLSRGIPLVILAISQRYTKSGNGNSIWVAKNSPYKTIQDLKGHTIGVYGLQSGGIATVREVLALKYGFNVDLEKGDFKFVELPTSALPAALLAGRIDAATLVHAQIYKAEQAGEFRSVLNTQDDTYELFGMGVPQIVIAGYADRVAAKPEVYKEVARMLNASIKYVLSHRDEVFPIIAAKDKIDVAYFDAWFKGSGEIPYAINAQDRDGLRKSWQAAQKIGAIGSVPDVNKVIWSDALPQ